MPRRTPRRRVLLAPLLLALLAVPAADAAPSLATVSRPTCTSAAGDPSASQVGFVVRMRDRAPASTSYGFRLRLQERRTGGRWHTLRRAELPAALRADQTARSGARRMVRRITVRGLRPGSAYRLRVQFRWVRPEGGVRTLTATSRTCVIGDGRPNVAVGDEVAWSPAPTAGEVVYRVPLRVERAAALAGRPVVVAVRQGGVELGRAEVDPSGGDEVVPVTGRRCTSGTALQVVVDPDREIDERDETDNVVRARCAAVTG